MYQKGKEKHNFSSFPKKISKKLRKQDGVTGGSGGPSVERHTSYPYKKYQKKCTSDGGVRRIFSPLTKFAQDELQKAGRKRYNSISFSSSPFRSTGLSRMSQYAELKRLALKALEEKKIFSIYGSCNPIRKALLERGWIEQKAPNRMNLSKIRNGTLMNRTETLGSLERIILSKYVEKYTPNFIWHVRDEQYENTPIDMKVVQECNTIINKIKADGMWTTKQGLCSSMKRNYWFYIEDVAEVNGPRTYNTYDPDEIQGFVNDYKITACTSLLKWVISMTSNKRPIFMKSGKMSLKVLEFALKRCKEYYLQKQHKDIDDSLSTVSSVQWNSFLKKYYRIIAKQDVFQEDKENKLPLYLSYATFLLRAIHKYRPQLSCEGCHNIWIIKPAHCSRGRGIRMASKLGVIMDLLNKANANYVIQKYIEEPLLIHDTKFDIRQYYLVTSTFPLVIWMYTECYLKFSSQKYSLKNYHEAIHLTNNAVQRNYSNCTGRHAELPQNNMWDSEMFKDYLKKIGKRKCWEHVIYPGMKKSIIGIMLNCQENLAISKNRFELYGCDFILDKNYKPWLIEINSCPDMNGTTPITAKICPAVLSDIIKVVIDYASDNKSSTGKFECIYRQPMTVPRCFGVADMFVRGYSLSLDYFYRGNIEVKESFDDAHIEIVRDIRAMLNKSKFFYENNVNDCDHNTESENELTLAAAVITELLDEIVDRINSESNIFLKSDKKMDANSSKKHKHIVKRTQSVTDIEALLKSTCNSRFNYLKTVSIEQNFNFSKLDDGPQGKGSLDQLDPIKKMFDNLTTSSDLNVSQLGKAKHLGISYDLKDTHNEMMDATTKIIYFIDQKKKEYLQQFL